MDVRVLVERVIDSMKRQKRSIQRFAWLVALSALPPAANAQVSAPVPLVVHSLGGDVSWVEGGGGNSGVIVGKKGVIVIDAKISRASGKELLDDIGKITPEPVNTVILTHSDRDHVNGLAAFPEGITVIAQENNKKEQERAIAAGGRDGPPADHLPTRLITKDKERVRFDGVAFELLHWAPAHTSGDLVVYLPKQKIVFTGDIVTNRPDPLIHLEKNGSSEGWIETMKGIVALDANTFVPGHGNAETKAEVQQYLAHAEAKRAKIQELVAQGKSLDEIKSAVGDAPSAQRGNGTTFATFTDVVYRELSEKK
jgi:glyoxylase-like metal-dependent hydrolase (beta-lactamase superfamily II)